MPLTPEPGRVLPATPYADDDGSADPVVRAALADHDAAPGDHARWPAALLALGDARLLVPVKAVLGEGGVEVGAHGLAQEKDSDMAVVLLTGADGRLGLLGFTGADSLTAWDPEARPVPVPLRTAAVAAVQEGAAAVVVDVAGPARFVLSGQDLLRVAQGWRVVRVGDEHAWAAPAPQPDDA